MFGGLGLLTGSAHQWICIPLSIRLYDDSQALSKWKGATVSGNETSIDMYIVDES